MDLFSMPALGAEIKTAARVVRSYPPQSSSSAHEVRVTLPLVSFLRDVGFYDEPGAIVVEQPVRKIGSHHGR